MADCSLKHKRDIYQFARPNKQEVTKTIGVMNRQFQISARLGNPHRCVKMCSRVLSFANHFEVKVRKIIYRKEVRVSLIEFIEFQCFNINELR